ncbi:hypothetical protein evm_009625 [Chilo suppressalis]|nr:hypothetical protein evm_009625 [Chilo suppressalis]
MSIDNFTAHMKLPKSENIGAKRMISALSAIALEMEKYHTSTSMSCHNFGENEDLYEKLSLCKTDLRVKKKRIKQLKQNLRKACIVAKTIISAKENETMSLHDDINNAKSECADFYMQNTLNAEMIEHLESENKALHEKLEHFHKFIRLGYEELQKMRKIPIGNVSTGIQLKEIILSCGQYFADYCNERDTCAQMEQKNRFLNNKVCILETNINAIVEHLKNVQYQNSKLRKENNLLKNKQLKIMESKAFKTQEQDNHCLSVKLNQTSIQQRKDDDRPFDLSTHLSLVENLLNDQDMMLKDLKKLSEELANTSVTNSTLKLSK